MRINLLLAFIFFSWIGVAAQRNNEFAAIDNKMLLIPDSSTKSVQSIARFTCQKFSNQHDKVRAIFYWVSKSVQYDIKNMYAINFHENKNEIIDKVLRTRKGICLDYAVLFSEIANKAGIKSVVIDGFTRQNGFVDYIPHVWCAAQVDSIWYLFDPTWGSGYISKSKYISRLSNEYFKIKAESLIKTHMPFDPQWQLLKYPVTYQEFYQGKTSVTSQKSLFNFNDSIAAYEKKSKVEQLITATSRMEKNGGTINSIVFDRLQYSKREIEYLQNKLISEQYNLAVNNYNTGVNSLNEFINYRNKKFIPSRSDSELKFMLDTIESSLNLSTENIKQIKNPDSNTSYSIKQLDRSIEEAYLNLNEQKTFLKKYLSTPKILRKTTFYKFSWLGVPLN